jgi:hypothetical protein
MQGKSSNSRGVFDRGRLRVAERRRRRASCTHEHGHTHRRANGERGKRIRVDKLTDVHWPKTPLTGPAPGRIARQVHQKVDRTVYRRYKRALFGTLHETAAAPSRSHTVDIELVALSLVSSGLPDGSTQHEATLAYDIAPLQGGKPTTAYAQLDITCNPKDPSGVPRCDVARARASDRNRHRGHVTVLK